MSASTVLHDVPAWYIVTVTGGTVLEHFPDRARLTTAELKPTQLWRIHRDSDSLGHERFAFENADTGHFLRAKSAGGRDLILNGEKQWWRLEKAPAPGAVYISCLEFDQTYLCNSVGSFNEKNEAEVWSRDRGWLPAASWYIKAPDRPVTIKIDDFGREWSDLQLLGS